MMNFEETYTKIMKLNALDEFISDSSIKSFELLTDELLLTNKVMNLTAITETDMIIAKHYADSLKISNYIPTGADILDVGCGAGFPSLPLAVTRADIKVTSLDSIGKKLKFISDVSKKLGLRNITTLNSRAEVIACDKNFRESFDIVCARAVAPLNILCEYCLPLVKTGGKFIAMKGASAAAELDNAVSAIAKLGGKLSLFDESGIEAPDGHQNHAAIIIQKISASPKMYPRNNSQINKNPL